jgi:hypothetical protein
VVVMIVVMMGIGRGRHVFAPCSIGYRGSAASC